MSSSLRDTLTSRSPFLRRKVLDGLELADGWPSSSGIGIQYIETFPQSGSPICVMYGNASEPVTWAW